MTHPGRQPQIEQASLFDFAKLDLDKRICLVSNSQYQDGGETTVCECSQGLWASAQWFAALQPCISPSKAASVRRGYRIQGLSGRLLISKEKCIHRDADIFLSPILSSSKPNS